MSRGAIGVEGARVEAEEPADEGSGLDIGLSDLVGTSAACETLREEISRAAAADSTSLVTGETGTGKNLVARSIHRLSPRAGRPFVHVDCSALSPSLIESELFGHERGAFTGAVARRAGRFELAGNGTIFLDEIGELEPRLQSKLLRVLEEREFDSVGSAAPRRMRARVIAATSRELEAAVDDGDFRADLYFRLHILRIHVPPLRERRVDIPAIALRAAERAARRLGWPVPALSEAFLDALLGYEWPGNVRQLMNLVEAALVRMGRASPTPELVHELLRRAPARVGGGGRGDSAAGLAMPPQRRMARVAGGERSELAELLVGAGGNVARVARHLGIARSTLRYRIMRHGLEDLVPRN